MGEAREADPGAGPRDPNFRRLRYARYADDFLLCFAGPKEEAEEIREQLRVFLRDTLKLELSEEKTLITHAVSDAARFLGYEIISQQCDTKLDRCGRRSTNGNLALRVPVAVIRANCKAYQKKGRVVHRPELANESDYDIVQMYQWEYAGVVNYYRLAHNVSWLHSLHHVCRVRSYARWPTNIRRPWGKSGGSTAVPPRLLTGLVAVSSPLSTEPGRPPSSPDSVAFLFDERNGQSSWTTSGSAHRVELNLSNDSSPIRASCVVPASRWKSTTSASSRSSAPRGGTKAAVDAGHDSATTKNARRLSRLSPRHP